MCLGSNSFLSMWRCLIIEVKQSLKLFAIDLQSIMNLFSPIIIYFHLLAFYRKSLAQVFSKSVTLFFYIQIVEVFNFVFSYLFNTVVSLLTICFSAGCSFFLKKFICQSRPYHYSFVYFLIHKQLVICADHSFLKWCLIR